MGRYFKENKIIMFCAVVLSIMCAIASSFISIFLQRILDAALAMNMNSFLKELITIVSYLGVLVVFTYLYSLMSKKCICKVIKTMRKQLYNGIIYNSIEEFQKKDTADYLSNFNNDIKIVEENYLNVMFTIIENIVLFLASLIIMIYYSPIVTAFTGISILLMLILPSLVGGALEKKQNDYSEELADFTSVLKDMLLGFEVIKTYGMDRYSIQKFKKCNAKLTNSKYKVDRLFALAEIISMVLSVLMQIGVIALSAYLVMQGNLTVGTLLALTQLGSSLAAPLGQIFENFPKIQSTKEILNRFNEIALVQENRNTTELTEFQNCIELKNINFSYGDEQILKNINLNLEKGKKYAVVGTNGCGKSTLLKLIAGYFSSYKGDIYYDQRRIDNHNRWSISNIASIVHQNIYMFNESIKDNICLHKDWSDIALNEAIENSGLGTVLQNKDITLDYEIRENGLNLSGGQKQRIAIARALIQNKPLLIVDEGTSAIEQKASYEIEQSILKTKDITLLAITHNLVEDNLKFYDEIIVMNEGQIIEKGNYAQLIQNKGQLYNMIH